MRPADLTADRFRAYQPDARELASRELKTLQILPLAFAPLLLRELIDYDWKFPAERRDLDEQFRYLDTLSPAQIQMLLKPFASLQLSPELESLDWVNGPAQFSEKLSAHLWATHQIDQFRQASIGYVHTVNGAKAQPASLPVPRLSLIVIGQNATTVRQPLFRKLRRYGVHYTNVQPDAGVSDFLAVVSSRAKEHPVPFGHWYIDGSKAAEPLPQSVACISYQKLQPVRNALIRKMSATMAPGGGGPELLRTELARLQPSEFGLPPEGSQGILSRFQLSLLTQGSGTQIFSTTFVQWASREVLRRAQPLTLMARYSPRQREAIVQGTDAPDSVADTLDPNASLIDADLGAYYTWINQQRLPNAQQSSLLVWLEGHSEAFASSPKLKPGTSDDSRVSLQELAQRLS